MEISKQDKIKLIHFLNFVCDYEASKPIEEMDEELIKSCVKVLLELQDKHVKHSPEFIDEQVRKIFRKEETEITEPETVKTNKKQINKKKVWLVAACIAILVALFSIVSFANDWNVFDFLSEKFGSVHSAPIETEMEFDGSVVIVNNNKQNYYSLEDALAKEKIDILFPKDIGAIKIISMYQKQNKNYMSIVFEDSNLSMIITLNSDLSNQLKAVCNKKIIINHTEIYICAIDDAHQVQAYFIYDENLYTITSSDEDSLMNILKNMEEVKHET